MYIIEIEENKIEEMSECVEKMLHYGGRLMSCLEESKRSHGRMGERGGYGNRGNYGNRMDMSRDSRYGNRFEDEDMYEMGERRYRRY